MKVLALALGIAGVLFSCPLQAQMKGTARWQAFESAAGRYKVAFPAAPVMKQGKLRTDIGVVVSTRHTAEGVDATYDVTYNDYPKDGIARLSSATLLETTRDGLVFQSKGHLASDRPITLGKVPGRELEIMGEDGMLYRIRLLLAGIRLYQLTAMARPPALPEEQKFFDSFQLTRETP